MGSGHADFIRRQLERDSSLWRISAWHVNQGRMQVGTKGDEAGWGVYEESRLGGAIIATAHEHSYSRTHLMSGMADQKVASRDKTLRLRKGRSFAFVSGLGGAEIRPQSLSGDWWASIYTSTQGAKHGALFATFNVDGDARKARFYFKNVDGAVVDSFEVISELDKPILPGIAPGPAHAHSLVLDPVALGLPADAKFGLLEMSGRTLARFEKLTGPVSVSVPRAGVFLLWGEGVKGRLLRKIVFLP
jgi:hypothetical protein